MKLSFGLFVAFTHGLTKWPALLQELNGQDGLRALSFFEGTSACILKGTGWVSAVLVLLFGFEALSFGPVCTWTRPLHSGRIGIYSNDRLLQTISPQVDKSIPLHRGSVARPWIWPRPYIDCCPAVGVQLLRSNGRFFASTSLWWWRFMGSSPITFPFWGAHLYDVKKCCPSSDLASALY